MRVKNECQEGVRCVSVEVRCVSDEDRKGKAKCRGDVDEGWGRE